MTSLGVEDSCKSQSLQETTTSETEEDSIFRVTVELCGGLEQLTADNSKELALRFLRRKKRNADFQQASQSACSSSGREKTQAMQSSLPNGGTTTPQLNRVGSQPCDSADAVDVSISRKEVNPSNSDTSTQYQEEEEISLPLYQVIGFLSSFVLTERPDMFADAYEGAVSPTVTTVAQRQQKEEEGANVSGVYPIEYVLPGGISPPMQLRPGVLALINDIDVEVLGGVEAPVHSSDCITLISTLHGG